MVKKTLIYLSIVLLLVGVLGVGIYQNEKQDIKYCDSESIVYPMKEPLCYQGPVRLGDDLEHFRKTGETIPRSKE